MAWKSSLLGLLPSVRFMTNSSASNFEQLKQLKVEEKHVPHCLSLATAVLQLFCSKPDKPIKQVNK